MLLSTQFFFFCWKCCGYSPYWPQIYKWFGFCLITSFHSFDTETEKYFFLIVLCSNTKFAPFKLRSLCFTQGMRHSEDELHSGLSIAKGREPWLPSTPNLWCSWEENKMVKFSWNIHRLNSLLLCDGLTHGHQIQSLSSRKTISGKCWLYFQPYIVNIQWTSYYFKFFFPPQVLDKLLIFHPNYDLLIVGITQINVLIQIFLAEYYWRYKHITFQVYQPPLMLVEWSST